VRRGCAGRAIKKSKDLREGQQKEAVQVIVPYLNDPSQADVEHPAARGGRTKNLHFKVRGTR